MIDAMKRCRLLLLSFATVVLATALTAQTGPVSDIGSSQSPALKEWLTYIASDELQGRQVYTEGLGLAASYIADLLKQWKVKPAGEGGSYFQTVEVVGVKTESRSSVTVRVNGQSRTFNDGEHISLPRNMGGKQTIIGDQVRFVGYGLQASAANMEDYADVDVNGKVVVWLGATGPRDVGKGAGRLLVGRSRLAIEKGAIAVIAPPGSGRGAGRGAAGTRNTAAEPSAGRAAQAVAADFTTAQRYDRPIPPIVTAQDEFFEFLFSGSDVKYAELRALAEEQEPLPRFSLEGVTLTFNIDADYSIVTRRLSRNVVGIIEGTDPKLKGTYVAFGAHYDHIGYQQTVASGRDGDGATFGCPGQTRPTPPASDIVNNGADDDGSGTVALMGIARAFATGSRPKRSLVFVWHTAEETGLQGSRYNADYPVVPNDRIIAHLNVDMVGRNRCDDVNEANTVYLIGSDRISTELHNISEDANAAMAKPMTLDYELNDPQEPQSLYTRSDHYSYAAKGIPVIFYTTGLHRDYHYLTDEIEKIDFEKLTRISQLVYLTGQRLANVERAPERDNKGPRVGRGTRGRIE
jgi:hypothetical protein